MHGRLLDNILSGLFFGALFILFPLLSDKSLLDYGLLPRYTALAAVTFLVSAGLLLSQSASDQRFIQLLALRPFLFLLAFIGWTALSTFFSRNEGEALSEFFRLTIAAVVVPFSAWFIRVQPVWLKRLPVLASGLFLVLLAYFLFQFYPLAEKWVNTGAMPVIDYSFGGAAGNKNYLSEALLLLSFLLIAGLRTSPLPWKFIFAVFLVLLLPWLYLLKSTSVWLAAAISFFIACLYFLIFRPAGPLRRVSGLIVAGTLTVAGISFIFLSKEVRRKANLFKDYVSMPIDVSVTTKANDNSVYERLLMWRNSVRLIGEHPVLGAGLTDWRIDQAQYGVGGTAFLNTGMVRFEHPHNEYLLIASEEGIVGLILFLAFFAALFAGIRRKLNSGNVTDTERAWLETGFIAMAAFLIISFFGYPRSREIAWFIALVQAGVLIALTQGNPDAKRKKYSFSSRWFFFLTTALSVISLYVFTQRMEGERLLRKAMQAQLSGDHGRVLRLAKQTERFYFPLDPTATPVAWYAGTSLFRMGRLKEAVGELERARDMNPYHLRILNDLGTTYEQLGRREEAIAQYRQLLAITPSNTEGRLNISAAYYNIGQADSSFVFIRSIRKEDLLTAKEKKNYAVFLSAILKQVVENHSNELPDSLKPALNYVVSSDSLLFLEFRNSSTPDEFRSRIKARLVAFHQ